MRNNERDLKASYKYPPKVYNKPVKISGRLLYPYYNKLKYKSGNKKKDIIMYRDEFEIFVTKLISTIGDCMLESDGGVYVKGLGYFGFVMDPLKGKRVVKKGKVNYYSYYTDHRWYSLIFTPDAQFQFWSMDGAFLKGFKVRAMKLIKSGVRFKTYLTTFFKLRLHY